MNIEKITCKEVVKDDLGRDIILSKNLIIETTEEDIDDFGVVGVVKFTNNTNTTLWLPLPPPPEDVE